MMAMRLGFGAIDLDLHARIAAEFNILAGGAGSWHRAVTW